MATSTADPELEEGQEPTINEREAEQMQQWYDMPAYDKNAPESESAKELADEEASGNYYSGSGKAKKQKSKNEATNNDAATGAAVSSTKKVYGKLLGSKKKKAGFGAFIIAAILYFFLSIASGPAQLIQVAQLMQQFHFNSSEDQADVRTSRLIRFIRSGGNAQELRVGYLGKRMAVKMEAKLAKAGFKYLPDGVGKFYGGFEVDPENSNFKGKSVDEIRAELAKEGITTEVRNGSIVVPGNQKYSTNVRSMQSLLKRTGSYKVTAPLQARTVAAKWFGFSRWHAMRKADARVNQTLTQFWEAFKKKFATRVGKGSVPITPVSGSEEKKTVPTCKNGPSNCTAAEQAAIDEANTYNKYIDDQINEANKALKGLGDDFNSVAGEDNREIPDKTNELAEILRGKLLGKATVGAFSVTAVLCVINEMNKTYEALKEARIILPLVRAGLEVVAAGNQVMNGDDVDLDQLGGYDQLLTDDGTGSWLNAASIQAELGNTKSGEITDAEKAQKDNFDYIGKGSPFSAIIDTFNSFSPVGIGKLCSTAGQVVAGVITVGLSIVTGGGFSVVSFLGSALLSGVATVISMKLFVGLMTGTAVDATAEGAIFGNNINYGTRLAASGQNLSHGGKALSPQDEEQIQQISMQNVDQDFASKSIAYRLFNPYDPKSTFGKALAGQPTSFGGSLSRMSASFFNIGKMFSKLPDLATATAGAQTFGTYDYGFPAYGFSAADMDNDAVYDPYQNAKDVLPLITGGSDLVGRANKCFGAVIAKDSNGTWGVTHSSTAPNPYDITDNNWSDATKWNCNDSSTDWLKFRFFIFDTTMMDALSCFEEDDATSCNNVGFSPPPATGGGGPVDCNNLGDPSTWKDPSAGTPPDQWRDLIASRAPGRTCPNTPGFQTPSDAVPNDPAKQYFAYDGCGDDQCNIQTDGDGKQYIRVKYRDPGIGSNTETLYLE